MGSSVIFLVVIAIWAAFLLPDLQLRRHNLAQSRSAARVLGASRILAKAGRKRDDDTERHHVASQAGSDTEPRSGVAIHAAGSTVVTAPETSATVDTSGSDSLDSPGAGVITDDPGRAEGTGVAARSDAEGPGAPWSADETPAKGSRFPGLGRLRRSESRVAESRGAASRGTSSRMTGMALAWALAVLLLVALIAVPTTVVLSFLGVIPWWSVGVAVGSVVVVVALLRVRVALRRRARVRARHEGQGQADSVTGDARTGWRSGSRFGRRRNEEVASRTESAERDEAPVQVETPQEEAPAARRGDDFFDQDEDHSESAKTDAAPAEPVPMGPTSPPTVVLPVVDDRPGRWTPQALPRPTYLLKPKAPEGPLTAPTMGSAPAYDPFLDLLEGDGDEELPQARAV